MQYSIRHETSTCLLWNLSTYYPTLLVRGILIKSTVFRFADWVTCVTSLAPSHWKVARIVGIWCLKHVRKIGLWRGQPLEEALRSTAWALPYFLTPLETSVLEPWLRKIKRIKFIISILILQWTLFKPDTFWTRPMCDSYHISQAQWQQTKIASTPIGKNVDPPLHKHAVGVTAVLPPANSYHICSVELAL